MFDKEAIQEITKGHAVDAARLTLDNACSEVDGLAALPETFKVHDLEKYMATRRHARGSMVTSALADFATYVSEHHEGGTMVFVNSDRMAATAVLNLGTPVVPGHADNTATMQAKATAAYKALTAAATGQALKQTTVAEFLEDWPGLVECFNDAGAISPPQAIAAVRQITIEGLKRLEVTEQQLSASKSTFEQVQAKSAHPLPTLIYFKCVPYLGLPERQFVLRLGVQTSDKPMLTLRVVNAEKHAEEMAAELATLVRTAVDQAVPVLVGVYVAGA